MTEMPFFRDIQLAQVAITADKDMLKSWLNDTFQVADLYHGVAHAHTVAKQVKQICDNMTVPLSRVDTYCVEIAAVLHDIGYAAFTPEWSPDRREHVNASLDFVRTHLSQLQVCTRYPATIDIIAFLIAHHDDTNFRFPSLAWQGRAEPLRLNQHNDYIQSLVRAWTTDQYQAIQLLLGILSEADALAATGSQGAQRTFGYSTARGIPLVATGNPLSAWCWEEGALGNIRIGAKRARIDAVSSAGKQAAATEYAVIEQFIATICLEHHIPYYPELPLPDTIVEQDNTAPQLTIEAYQGWLSLAHELRSVTLLGDTTLLPYANAQITVRRMPLSELRPIATYALITQLNHQRRFFSQLATGYALNLFDLTGMVTYRYGDQIHTLAPPIIETYREPATGEMTSVILDGLHRILLAHELQMDAVWVVEVTEVPEHMPVVSLPVDWADVTHMSTVPATNAKRRFRFDSASDLADTMQGHSNVSVTDANFRYFLYRDLAKLGSTGVRSTRTTE